MRSILLLAMALTFAFIVPASAEYRGETALPSPSSADKMAAIHNDEGVSAYKAGDLSGAVGHFREAVKIAHNFAEAHYNLGLALHGLKKHKEAADEFKLAMKLAPDNKAIAESKVLEKHVNM